jgi:hypothetical protein
MTGQQRAVLADSSSAASRIGAATPVAVFDIETTAQEISILTCGKVRRSACVEHHRQDECARLEVSE